MRAVVVTLLAACAACSTAAPVTRPVASRVTVQVWTGGDDGLTQRLADVVRDEFSKSSIFTLASMPAPNSLTVTIPTNVDWEEVGGRARVIYKVRFERGHHVVSETGGVCWEDDLRNCARRVVEKATSALTR
jgi:hypothetical protein